MRNLLQTTLDTALYPDVLVYWQRRAGPDTDEYVIYTVNGDSGGDFADNTALTKNASATVKYYYRVEKAGTYAGRQDIETRENTIETALKDAGFDMPFGKFDAGEIDGNGYFVTVFECEYWRVV